MKLSKEQRKMIPFYTYRIEWSEEDKVFVVSVEELKGCLTHGETPEEALKMAHEAVEGYLETCAANNYDIPLPVSKQKYKGDILLRTTPEIHKRIASESMRQGYKSINRFLIDTIKKAVGA